MWPQVRQRCHLNRAACRLKLKDDQGAVADCSVVLLSFDSNSWKALHRRGQAYANMQARTPRPH